MAILSGKAAEANQSAEQSATRRSPRDHADIDNILSTQAPPMYEEATSREEINELIRNCQPIESLS